MCLCYSHSMCTLQLFAHPASTPAIIDSVWGAMTSVTELTTVETTVTKSPVAHVSVFI